MNKIKHILKINDDFRDINMNENDKLFGNINEDANVNEINNIV